VVTLGQELTLLMEVLFSQAVTRTNRLHAQATRFLLHDPPPPLSFLAQIPRSTRSDLPPLPANGPRRPRDAFTVAPTPLLLLHFSTFDWNLNQSIPHLKIHPPQANAVLVRQSGSGKSSLIQSTGLAACVLEQHDRYITSAELLAEHTAALADHTIHDHVRFYAKFALLMPAGLLKYP
jgi:hypothetical protein